MVWRVRFGEISVIATSTEGVAHLIQETMRLGDKCSVLAVAVKENVVARLVADRANGRLSWNSAESLVEGLS